MREAERRPITESASAPPVWSNWSGSVTSRPARIVAPQGEEELAAAVEAAAARGETVRPVGAGHSFVPLCAADEGTVIRLEAPTGVIAIDHATGVATVWGGTRIKDLGEPLREAGWAMETLGDIDRQALAGALATGTHGTGFGVRSLSNQMVGARVVLAGGRIRDFDARTDGEEMRALAVCLGALGITTRVRLRLVPTYRLHEKTWTESSDTCLEELEKHIHGNRHFEFFWNPARDRCLMKALNPTDSPPDRLEDREWERIDHSDRIFPSERKVKFNEIEFSVPHEAGPPCFRELRRLLLGPYRSLVEWPLEYRTVAADDLMLSPAHGRQTVAISAHQAAELPFDPFFRDVEAVFRDHGGRPHWGKIHRHDPQELRTLYPRWDDFHRLRRCLDPEGVFLNSYLHRLFGRDAD